jgi:hypothetical protein
MFINFYHFKRNFCFELYFLKNFMSNNFYHLNEILVLILLF